MTNRNPLDDLWSDEELLAESRKETARSEVPDDRTKRQHRKSAMRAGFMICTLMLLVLGVLIGKSLARRSMQSEPQSSTGGTTHALNTTHENLAQDGIGQVSDVVPLWKFIPLSEFSDDVPDALPPDTPERQRRETPDKIPPLTDDELELLRDFERHAIEAGMPPPLTPEELYKKLSPSVVRVNVRNAQAELVGHGSGFFVRDDSTVVTNFHVIEDGHSAEVVLSDGTTLLPVLGVEAFDMQSDVAILRVSAEKQKKIRPLILGRDELPQPASKAYVIGSPEGLDNSFSDGSVSGHREMDGRTWIQTTAPISPGSSGSPLFNERGLVIGVATKSRVGGQNLNLALASLHLRKLLPNRMGLPIRMTELPSRKTPQKHAADPAKPVGGDIFTAIRAATMDAASLSGDPRTRAMRTVLERLESIPAEEKQKVAYWETRSFIHFVNGRRQLAFDDADEAVRIDPKDRGGWNALYCMLQHPSDDSERKRRLEVRQQLIQLVGEHAPAWYYKDLGDAFQGLGRYDEAVAAYGKALVRDPKCGSAYYGLGKVHKNRKKYTEAIANYKKSIEFPSTVLDPSSGYLGLAECYERMRDYREAIRAEEKALELLPEGFDDLEKNIRETLGRTRFLQAME